MKTSKVNDVVQIATKLDGNIEFETVLFSQVLVGELGESVNDLLFVKKMFGLYFYTSRSAMDQKMRLANLTVPIPVFVVGESKNVFQIK